MIAPEVPENRQHVVDGLRAAGVDTIFGVMGNGNVDVIADAVQRAGMRYVAARHEAGAVAMADGYARATGRIGAATVTHGPGLTNAMTAITTASRALSTVLVLTGDANGAPGRSTQRIDQEAVILPTGARLVSPPPTGDWLAAVREAVSVAEQGACVVVNLPVEAMRTPASPIRAEREAPLGEVPASTFAGIERAAELLTSARRPLILAGRGAVRAGARDALVELASRLGARTGTSLAARDLFSDLPEDIGIVGGFGTPESMEASRSCDVVLCVGASLNLFTTDNDSLLRQAQIIGVDRVAPRQGSPVDLSLVGDASEVLSQLLDLVPRPARRSPVWQVEGAAEDIASRPGRDSPGEFGLLGAVLERLQVALPPARTLVYDHGNLATTAIRHLTGPDPAAFIFMTDFGSIGLALPAAVGAAVGRPDRTTVCVVGDGALMMSLAELDTLARVGGDVLVLALNDGAYGAEYFLLDGIGADVTIARFDSAGIAKIAESIGIPSAVVASESDLPLIDELLGRDGPRLIEVTCRPPLGPDDTRGEAGRR